MGGQTFNNETKVSDIHKGPESNTRDSEYYDDLESILNKYQIKEKPHLIYNLDETGLQPEHRPPSVIASK